jgi:hypothetical protein
MVCKFSGFSFFKLTFTNQLSTLFRTKISAKRFRSRSYLILEVLIIIAWGLYITGPILDMNPQVIPAGREYISAIQTNHFWENIKSCGWCAIWDGSTGGGFPALADIYGSPFHPLVMIATLGWGVINGSKIALAGAFIMAGLAQWWLASEMDLGIVPRLWAGCLAVAAGNLAGKMDLGLFGIIISTAACALILPPLLRLDRNPDHRNTVILGFALASAILAGQGYMQIGLLFCLTAVLLLYPYSENPGFGKWLKPFALSAVLGILLAAFFLLPAMHFFPQLEKWTTPDYQFAQPFAFVPLNLVINDPDFFRTGALQKMATPSFLVNFIGWLAILLALLGFFRARDSNCQKTANFLAAFIFLTFWISSAEPFLWLVENIPLLGPVNILAAIRFPTLISGLAVAPILGLAALGLEMLLIRNWPSLYLTISGQEDGPYSLNLRWLLLIPLVASLFQAKEFGAEWINYIPYDRSKLEETLGHLKTNDLQWASPPFGEHFWVVAARELNLKMSPGLRPYWWLGRTPPKPVYFASRFEANTSEAELVDINNGLYIYRNLPGNEFAIVHYPDGDKSVCTAQGIGGEINILCDLDRPGTLDVKENYWPGWRGEVNGDKALLLSEDWIRLYLPAGKQEIRLRYFPWDVPLGMLLSFVGLGASVYLWVKNKTHLDEVE